MPEKVDDCVQSALEDNPNLSESDARAICKSQHGEGEAQTLAECEFTRDELDWIADNVDGYAKAETSAGEFWVNGEDGVVVQAETAVGQKSFTGPAAPIRSVETKETLGSAASKLDVDELPDEIREAVEADDFIIYGKASIEQYDRDDVPTKLNMDAMADALDRFFGSDDAPGIISLEHQDIPVGRPVREHTLDSDTVIDLPNDGEYEFEAGETLRTEIREADGDGRPEFWLVARLANDSDIARRTRLRALNGDLDGFSVTFKRNDDEPTQGGREVHELDLHAVTLGTDEQIKNPGSNWDVAEFKAWLPDRLDFDSAIDAMADVVQDMTDDDNKDVTESIREKLGIGQKGDDDEVDESIEQKTEEIADQIGAKQSTVQEAVNEIADEAGVPTEDVLDMLEPVLEGEMGEEDVENDGDYEDDEDEEPDDGEMKAGIDEEELDETVEEKLDEKLDNVATLDDVEEKLDEYEGRIADSVGDAVDEVMQKARTGETPSPGSNEEDTTAKVGDIVKESGN